MNKSTMILADGTAIELEAGASLDNMCVLSADKDTMMNTWGALTESNLAAVQIKNSDGTVVANYTDLVLISETSTENEDGTILTSFHLRAKMSIEKQLDTTTEQTQQNTANIDYLAMESGVEL